MSASRFLRGLLRFGVGRHGQLTSSGRNRTLIPVTSFHPPTARFLSGVEFNPPHMVDPVVPDSLQVPSTSFTKKDRQAFLALLPDIIRSLTFEGVHQDMPLVNKHLAQCIQYNVSHGKLNRGLMVPQTFKLLTEPDQHTEENMKRAIILGWCVELLQSFFLVSDDMMDGSSTRRGQPCWYKRDEIGTMAINDAILLETSIYTLLHNHFHDQPNYLDTLDAFLYTTRHTAMGQALDLLSSYSQDESLRKCNLDDFNMKRYASIIKHKTSYYSFYLPVQLGMGLAGIRDPELYRQARTILFEMGHFFQVQDDFLDCFGDPKVTGKIGTDIQDGKCSWLIVVAMQRATRDQKNVLRRTYGSKNEDDVATVKKIYNDLNIQKFYRSYEELTVKEISDLINRMSGGAEQKTLNHQIFRLLLAKIYKRDH